MVVFRRENRCACLIADSPTRLFSGGIRHYWLIRNRDWFVVDRRYFLPQITLIMLIFAMKKHTQNARKTACCGL
jgi:hypothetical protein